MGLVNSVVGHSGNGVTCSSGDLRFADSDPIEARLMDFSRCIGPEHLSSLRDIKLGSLFWKLGGILNQCSGSVPIQHREKFGWILICSVNSGTNNTNNGRGTHVLITGHP